MSVFEEERLLAESVVSTTICGELRLSTTRQELAEEDSL